MKRRRPVAEAEGHDMAERETLEVDVLIVGGGPAGLSAALRLAQLQKAQGRRAAVDRRAREGARGRRAQLSGALLDPSALARADSRLRGQGRAARAAGRTTTTSTSSPQTGKLRLPITPPPLQQSRQLHHLAQPVRAAGWRSRSKPKASTCSPGFAGQRRADGRRARRSACAPATAASASTASRRRRSSRASTSAPR